MKRILVIVLALLLAAVPALAEYVVTPLEMDSPELDAVNGALIAECEVDGERGEAIYSYDGTQLSEGYYQIYTAYADTPHVMEVYNLAEGTPAGKRSGVIRDDGSQLVPPQYDIVEIISSRWQAGIMLKEGTEGDSDYNIFGETSKLYQVDTADLYFDGLLIATVGRDVFAGRGEGFGAYLGVQNSNGESFFVDIDGNTRPVDYYGDEYTLEYDDDGNQCIIHNGSGQQAFVPECTLAAEEVEIDRVLIGSQALDLQGNVICEYAREYANSSPFHGGLAIVYSDDYSYVGVVNLNGEEIIPTEYDDIGDGTDVSLLNSLGYIIARNAEGKYGALDAAGNVAVDFTYEEDACWNGYSFLVVNNDDDTSSIVSAVAGELPGRYKYVSANDGSTAVVVEDAEGHQALLSVTGEELIPISAGNEYLVATMDGSVALGYADGTYSLYVMQ